MGTYFAGFSEEKVSILKIKGMSLTGIITGGVIEIAKSFFADKGKQAAHDFIESATGKKLGQIIPYRRKEGNPNVLLFVHGFSGNSAETFGETLNMLVKNPQFGGWDIFSIGYSSDIFPSIGKGLWSVNPDISKVADYLNTMLAHQFRDYKQIAIVAHSMGGLAVQRAVLNADSETFKKIKYLILFGTPSSGLRKASLFRFWNTQVRDLSHQSKFIQTLRKEWSSRFTKEFDFTFKTIAGSKDEFVPVQSSLSPFDKKYHGIIEGNHITMIKPIGIDDNEHQSYNIILNTLLNKSVYLQGNPDEVNIMMGNYQSVINQYLPNAASLSTKPLIDLVFALECSGQKQLALQVLLNHPDKNSDTDILGVIGGRYKREFLLNGLKGDFDQSVEYYSKALSMAKKDKNKPQIFYHAINLAFLNIFGKDDRKNMKTFAQLALDNCDLNSQNVWEIATIAEASLYLGNEAAATAYYQKAAGIADMREKLSIYSNAYLGYQALVSSKNKNAGFLQMLEQSFLK
jgi:pimeloyl-ACP methyl ester carboxylesterase